MDRKKKFDTLAVRLQTDRSKHREHSVPVFETSSYVFNSAEEARAVFAEEIPGNIYTRFGNPNTDELICKLCALEGAEDGVATASGMAAVYLSLTALLRPGDHILSARQIFGTTSLLFTQILPKWGISHSYADINNKEEWEENIMPATRLIYAETPSNPGLDLIDLKWLGKLARKNDLYLIIDNCFATPYLQRPIQFGADLVVHSTTKFIDGQGRTIGGAVLGNKEIMKEVRMLSKITGPVMSPHTAWLLSKSLETLTVRMERHCSNALALARHLEKVRDVAWVKYPFLPSHPQYHLARRQMKLGGGLVTFELKGGQKRAHRFINALQMMSITSNLGDARTTVTHPATTTHSKLSPAEKKMSGITDGLVRVSVGLEHIDDILADFDQAIRQPKK
ncbi:MAG: PLP-dependent transferase [Bacteroidales bacterium]|nr:PLP-dependent transferase [Bacteroidales bacterium]